MTDQSLPAPSQQNNPSREWLTVADIAAVLNCTPSALRQIIKRHGQRIENHLRRIAHPKGHKAGMILIDQEGLLILTQLRRDFGSSKATSLDLKQKVAETAIAKTQSPRNANEAIALAMQLINSELSEKVAAVEDSVVKLQSAVTGLVIDREQATEQLHRLPPPQVEARKMTDRALLRQVINTYSKAKGILYNEVWHKFYKEIYYRLGINCQLQAKHRGVLCINILEESGMMTEAYAIACELFKI